MSELIIETDPLHTIGELVRCDDCIYRDGKTPGQPNILCWQMHSDDYCSYGTKREIGTYCEDIVTVVRCKDCKWWKYIETEEDTLYGECCVDMYFGSIPTVGDHFCSNGEREKRK